MDLAEYKTNSQNEYSLKNDSTKYLGAAITVTVFLVLALFIFFGLIGGSGFFQSDSIEYLFPLFFMLIWISIPLALSAIYWIKFLDKKTKLLINENCIGYSTNFFDNLTLKKIKNAFKTGFTKIDADGVDFQIGFYEWNQIINYQFVILTTANKAILYGLEIKTTASDKPIFIYIPDKKLKTFEKVKEVVASFALKKGIIDLGLAQKTERELTSTSINLKEQINIFHSGIINSIATEKDKEKETKAIAISSTESSLINSSPYIESNVEDEVKRIVTNKVTTLSSTSDTINNKTKKEDSAQNSSTSIVVSFKKLWQFLFPPKIVDLSGDFIVKRTSINGCLLVFLSPFILIIYSLVCIGIPANIFEDSSDSVKTFIMPISQIVFIYLIYRLYNNWKNTVLLRIGINSISDYHKTYYWKDISSYQYQICFKSVQQKGGGYVEALDCTKLVLFDLDKEYSSIIKIENTGWDKDMTAIKSAIQAITEEHGIEYLGSMEDLSQVI